MSEKIPDWGGDRYWGEIVYFNGPDLYGKPIYYTDGTMIPYKMIIPKIAKITAEELTK